MRAAVDVEGTSASDRDLTSVRLDAAVEVPVA